MVKLIGTNAGLVWRALSKAGRMSVKELKKETKLRADKELFAAIGWLATEGKLERRIPDIECQIYGHADCHKHCLCRWRREKRGEATVVGISS